MTFAQFRATVVHHAKRHVGVGIICAVAYFDPGNWSVDLQAGSQFGYKLLSMVLISGVGAVLLQVLACRLGCITGLDLASHCRLLLHNHPKYPRLVRFVFLYPLYVLSELAIISTDLAELLGSAIGLVLLFPKLPLWTAVLLTATDVLFILAIGDPSKGHGRSVRLFETVIILLVLVVFICFIVLIAKVSPHWPSVFEGFLPSKTLVEPSGLYAAIGILGATVMPHALFLGSYLATQDRVSCSSPSPPVLPPPTAAANTTPSSPIAQRFSFKSFLRGLFTVRSAARADASEKDYRTPYGERENSPLSFVRAHLRHGVTDIVLSLLGFAVLINSAILALAGVVFFYGPGRATNMKSAAGLFDAHDLIQDLIGKPAAVIFALALLCSGQSASITATLAGQVVSEGFIEWRVSPFLRRLITRLLGLIPSVAVALVVGKSGINELLVLSQVVLSIVLPFVMFPLIWLTSSQVVMRVRRPRERLLVATCADDSANDLDRRCDGGDVIVGIEEAVDDVYIVEMAVAKKDEEKETDIEQEPECVDDYIDYSNGWIVTCVSYAIWIVVVVANGYLLVTLAVD